MKQTSVLEKKIRNEKEKRGKRKGGGGGGREEEIPKLRSQYQSGGSA